MNNISVPDLPHDATTLDTTNHQEIEQNQLIDTLAGPGRFVALLASWVAMCGSLFFSEVLGWQPCLLCWYQRILMYPLAVILSVGILRRDRGVHLYALPLSIIGAGVSLYHYLLIKTTWFPPPACSVTVPCNVDYINWLGFINIPFLALTAFLIITVCMALWASSSQWLPGDDDETPVLGPDRLAVPIIVVVVVLSFVLGSTFV